MPKDPHLTILMEIKGAISSLEVSVARIQENIAPLHEKANKGVDALEKVNTLNTKINTLWAGALALPVVGGVLAYLGWIGPVHDGSPRDITHIR
jgi:hypothetical protein